MSHYSLFTGLMICVGFVGIPFGLIILWGYISEKLYQQGKINLTGR